MLPTESDFNSVDVDFRLLCPRAFDFQPQAMVMTAKQKSLAKQVHIQPSPLPSPRSLQGKEQVDTFEANHKKIPLRNVSDN